MAKQEIQKNSSGSTALAVPSDLVGGVTIEGDSSGLKLGELKLFQGSPTERAAYGKHDEGAFIDCLDMTSLGTTVRVAMLGGEKVIVKFIEGQKFPVYVYPVAERHKVPPADLVDGSGKGGRGTAAREQVLGIIIVEGKPFPYMFRFKSTAMPALTKTIQPLEERRRLSGQIMGIYELSSKADKGPGGEAYVRLTARPAGDLPESMHDLARKTKAGLAAYFAKGREAVQQHGEAHDAGAGGDDDIPV